jgi:hypothetical protein
LKQFNDSLEIGEDFVRWGHLHLFQSFWCENVWRAENCSPHWVISLKITVSLNVIKWSRIQ